MDGNRRDFLKYSIAPLVVPATAFGANDRPSYGLIGAGGRGRYVSQTFQKLGAECVAIAEVYEPNTQAALKNAPQAKTYVDYKDLELLKKLTNRQGKIIGRRKSGCTAVSQHPVTAAIKRARFMALMPYVGE
jgi:small subunit ribosomal protein S18